MNPTHPLSRSSPNHKLSGQADNFKAEFTRRSGSVGGSLPPLAVCLAC